MLTFIVMIIIVGFVSFSIIVIIGSMTIIIIIISIAMRIGISVIVINYQHHDQQCLNRILSV